MNERIRELTHQAGFTPGVMGLNRFTYFDPEKFAELIVKECLSLSDGLSNHYMNTHSARDQAMLLASIADYKNEIKKHFGVKE